MQRNANDLLFMVAEKNSSKCNQMIREISSSSPTAPSPFTCVINVNAKYFPRLKLTSNSSCSNTSNNNSSNNNTEFLLFDRIMCCLPCSPLCEMLNAGLRVLNVRGRLVYTVYSMNPVECEAVVSAVLLQQKGSFELVDVRSMMGDIKYEHSLNAGEYDNIGDGVVQINL
ncbi:hypothetical protein HELRODRAFT_192144 [Helobdella robusta]|uniref:SAM-dependent MTase RsmB/NOP-type domain-containing protein n=1 Tax=Helobdella robusta TaxID=6412 RepID=T1FTM4_HELRO|nr:hypothetical protein HELRODRAFT_192144 [Helobdella robusta]ESO02747.1 hypothetical protein HELRODRAFT_192144 [Helobdella robusta]